MTTSEIAQSRPKRTETASASPVDSLPSAAEIPVQPPFPTAARAVAVNRTHRVVREKAMDLRSRRSRLRSLYVPLGICAAFVLMLCSAIWSLLAQYETSASGIPDASSQIFVMLLWFLPACAAILALVLVRRNRADQEITR